MKILKFGGSSIDTPERILKVLDIIRSPVQRGEAVVVVVSALGGVTDRLIEMSALASKPHGQYETLLSELERRHIDCAEALISDGDREQVVSVVKDAVKELDNLLRGVSLLKEVPPRTMDLILSFGETLSATLMCESLNSRCLEAEFLDARKLIKTNRTFGGAHVNMKTSLRNIRDYFQAHPSIQIVTGFIGSTEENETTTLGRSGSDYTASIIGAALGTDVVEIWTDVDGIMTADPKKVPDAVPIQSMTYEEAMEMSHFGAEVIFPPTLQPAMSHRIPIRIRNTFHPEFPGTVIQEKPGEKDIIVTGISSIHDVALLRVQGSGMIGVAGIAGRLFQVLAKREISVFLITQASSEHSTCFAVKPEMADLARQAIEEEFSLEIRTEMIDKVRIERDLSTVAVVGENMRHTPGIAGKVFSALGNSGINVVAIAQGSSERNISIVVDQRDETRALRVLHRAFFDSGKKTVDLFIVGTGLVGTELLKLINQTDRPGISVRVLGLANSRQMVVDPDGISLGDWESRSNDATASMEMDEFIHQMIDNRSVHTVFVDCTASEEVADRYGEILSQKLSIVAANKIANTGSWSEFVALRETAERHGVAFCYETNVGAGLPVINTLKELVRSGDKVLKIEAVLSGTLSYLFNSFSREKPFSEMVRTACQLGYAEPDPRNDLSGMDVARKLLILAREIGLQLELKDIHVESLLPDGSDDMESLEEFFIHLRNCDDDFERRRSELAQQDKVMRYVASLENGEATAELKVVGEDHPFNTLTDNENMVRFTTERYHDNPLVIRGAGGGATLTAAGLFSEILKLAN